MEAIQIIIADRSQLVRMGLSRILYQVGYQLSVKEVSDKNKLCQILQKEKYNLLIISQSFINSFDNDLIELIQHRANNYRLVLIKDHPETKSDIFSDALIEFNDTEKSIYQKIENCLNDITKSLHNDRNHNEISHREKEVLKLVALGKTNKEIAEKLYISTHTVITHRKNITAKLGIKTIAGLTVYAVINKLISPEEIK